jgi:hypothetical protein
MHSVVGNKFGRPLAGGINIAPRYARQVDTTEFYSFRKYVLVIVHEFIHAMGFLEVRFWLLCGFPDFLFELTEEILGSL